MHTAESRNGQTWSQAIRLGGGKAGADRTPETRSAGGTANAAATRRGTDAPTAGGTSHVATQSP